MIVESVRMSLFFKYKNANLKLRGILNPPGEFCGEEPGEQRGENAKPE